MTPAARAVLCGLPDAAKHVIARCLTTSVRLELRDRAIREAVVLFPVMTPTAAAKALARELADGGKPGTARGDLVAAIVALNDGKPLRWRQIYNLAR